MWIFSRCKSAVDGLDQSDLLGQPMHQADAADADGPDLLGQFHARFAAENIGFPDRRAARSIVARSAAWHAAVVSLYSVFTRNPPFARVDGLAYTHYTRENTEGFEFFYAISVKGSLG